MIFNPCKVGDLGYLVIEDLYTTDELERIWNEIRHIDYVMDVVFDDEAKAKHRKKHNSCNPEDGTPEMSGFGLSLDEFYTKRASSAILTLSRKIMSPEVANKFMAINGENSNYDMVNTDFSLFNKYGEGECYKRHRDSSSFSAITFFARGKIEGGGLNFCDYDVKVEFKNNNCVIFPSRVFHQSEPFTSKVDRYSLAQFMVIRYFSDREVIMFQ